MRRERREEARYGNGRGGEHRGETWRETKLQTGGDRGKSLRHLKEQGHKRGMKIQQGKYIGELKGHMRHGKTKHETQDKSHGNQMQENTRHKTKI